MKKISSQKSDQENELQDNNIDFSRLTLRKISFERSKKILIESGLNPPDNEIRSIMDFAHQLAELLIKNFIIK